jgi:hypothetical protein
VTNTGPPRALFWWESLLVSTLWLATALQAYHKWLYDARRLLDLLAPCYMVTLSVLAPFALRSRYFEVASQLWNATVQTAILSGIALVLPDNSGVRPEYAWWAVPLFWVHHVVLTAVPLVTLCSGAFRTMPDHFLTFWHPFTYAAWTLVIFNVAQGLSLFFNTVGRTWGSVDPKVININYMIFPPPVAGESLDVAAPAAWIRSGVAGITCRCCCRPNVVRRMQSERVAVIAEQRCRSDV